MKKVDEIGIDIVKTLLKNGLMPTFLIYLEKLPRFPEKKRNYLIPGGNEDFTPLCTLDRIFYDATVFKQLGESFHGKKLETISLQTGRDNRSKL